MLQPFGPDIWLHDGPNVVGALGFHYPTRMAVIRLENGDLLVWSPTALAEDLRAAVAALGPVRFIVAPNTLHHSFIAQWCEAWPSARCFAVPQLAAARPDLRIHGDLTDTPQVEWHQQIDQVVLPPTSIMTEVVFFHRQSGTVLFTDLLQNLPPRWYRGWRAIVARLDLMLRPEPTVPRKFRLAYSDRPAIRRAIAKVLDWPAEKVLMAHGNPVLQDARAFLRRAFSWLMT
jgi:hypothetical protein